MHQFYLHVEHLVDMLCHVLCAVHRAVLSAGAAEAHHEVGESALDVALHRGIDQRIGEAEKLGFKSILVPKNNIKGINIDRFKIQIIEVAKVEEAFRHLFG